MLGGMSTWENATLSGIPERAGSGENQSREFVRQRVLDTALEYISHSGLTVGLGHLSYDEVILAAKVPRTTVYRVWPRKERFLEDLLRRLAEVTHPCMGSLDDETFSMIVSTLKENCDDLMTLEGRWALLVEVTRITGEHWIGGAQPTPAWRTYVALIATMSSMGSVALYNEIRSTMLAVEDQVAEKVAGMYLTLLALLGYRVRGTDVMDLVHIGASAVMGALLISEVRPGMVTQLGGIDPYGTGRNANWSPSSMAYTNAIVATLEPDPDYDAQVALAELAQITR